MSDFDTRVSEERAAREAERQRIQAEYTAAAEKREAEYQEMIAGNKDAHIGELRELADMTIKTYLQPYIDKGVLQVEVETSAFHRETPRDSQKLNVSSRPIQSAEEIGTDDLVPYGDRTAGAISSRSIRYSADENVGNGYYRETFKNAALTLLVKAEGVKEPLQISFRRSAEGSVEMVMWDRNKTSDYYGSDGMYSATPTQMPSGWKKAAVSVDSFATDTEEAMLDTFIEFVPEGTEGDATPPSPAGKPQTLKL